MDSKLVFWKAGFKSIGKPIRKKYLVIWVISFGFSVQVFGQSFQTFDSLSSRDILSIAIKSWPSDFVEIAKNPSKNWKKSAIAIGTTLALIATDKPSQRFIQNTVNPVFDWRIQPVPIISKVSIGGKAVFGGETNGYLLLGITGQYLGSIVFDYKKGQVSSVLATKSIVTSYAISHLVLKSVFARKRPYNPIDVNIPNENLPLGFTTSPFDFGNYEWPRIGDTRSGAALPSFHFTMYFAVARTLYRTYDNPWVAYGICAAGLLPYFEGHRHWLSDMFLGAVLGTIIGEITFMNFYNSSTNSTFNQSQLSAFIQKTKSNLSIKPRLDMNTTGFSLTYSLK